MVVKVYISGISGNKEVKKRQQRVLMILDSKNIKYEIIDITEPGKEDDKEFMQNNSKSNGGTVSDPNPRTPLPPQVFNDDEYCGDYDQFDLANEVDTLEQFLKVEAPPEEPLADNKDKVVNGVLQTEDEEKESKDKSPEKSTENSEVKETPTDNGEVESVAVRVSEEKEISVENEASSASPAPIEAEDTPGEAEETKESEVKSKETLEESASSEKEAEENGAVSSREQSEEKEETNEPKNLSEALIQSEQMASTE